jgi:ribosomal protein L37AE/L43A
MLDGKEAEVPVNTANQHDISELLTLAGARPRGNRHDCPKCGGVRTVTHTAECFYCHHCQWKGNAVTLQKELGIYRRLPSEEYREIRRKRERASEAALRLYAVAHQRELSLQHDLRSLGRMEQAAHDAGLDKAETWDTLAEVYAQRPAIEAELDVLETGSAREIFNLRR